MVAKLKSPTNSLNQDGFSLLEVMIALTIFATFITVFLVSNGSNLADSTLLREEIKLRRLCDNKLKEIMLNPPQFREALTLSSTTKTFEDDKDYSYTITWKRFIAPDLAKLMGTAEDNESDNGMKKILMKKITDSLKQIIWQLNVTVMNKETQYPYSLSTWLYNDTAKLDFTSF